jgi:hypothetical protein
VISAFSISVFQLLPGQISAFQRVSLSACARSSFSMSAFQNFSVSAFALLISAFCFPNFSFSVRLEPENQR